MLSENLEQLSTQNNASLVMLLAQMISPRVLLSDFFVVETMSLIKMKANRRDLLNI